MMRRDAFNKAASWKSMGFEGFLWFNTQKKVRFRLTEINCTKPYFCRKFHLIVLCFLLISGCATYVPPKPGPTEFRSRVETQRLGGVRVSAVILNAEESRQIFGSPLADNNIQPIWIEVENQTDQDERSDAGTHYFRRHFHPPDIYRRCLWHEFRVYAGAQIQIHVSNGLAAYDWHCGFNACLFQAEKVVLKVNAMKFIWGYCPIKKGDIFKPTSDSSVCCRFYFLLRSQIRSANFWIGGRNI